MEGQMTWFLILLVVTAAIRGLGAGIIWDVAFVSLPLRKKIGAVAYARYARANFEGRGSKTYGAVSILGALLTIAVTVFGFFPGNTALVSWSIAVAMAATVIAFLGTSRALPALMAVRKAPDDEAHLIPLLERFARWHSFSAAWQIISFIALMAALVAAL
jgi:hypothetical protein